MRWWGKNPHLGEFLKQLQVEDEKRGKIVAFVEEITFEKLKELSTGVTEDKKMPKLRISRPWDTQ